MKELSDADRVAVAAVGVGATVVAAISAGAAVIGAIRAGTGGSVLRIPADAPAEIGRGIRWTEASVPSGDADAGERALLAAGELIGGLAGAAVALAVAYLCWRVWAGRGFGASLTRTIWFTAGALVVGPAISSLLKDLAANLTVERLGLHDPLLIGFTFKAGAFGAGLALAAVGAVFARGERLQRDTAGLV